jgi:hypothetical protein
VSSGADFPQGEEQMKQSVLAGLSILALVVGPALSAQPENEYDGVYTGKRSLKKGTASPTCPAEDDVSVTIHGETLTFTNSSLKNYVMPFDPDKDGSFGRSHVEEGGAVAHYHSRIAGGVIEADAENPLCEYHWHLKKENQG